VEAIFKTIGGGGGLIKTRRSYEKLQEADELKKIFEAEEVVLKHVRGTRRPY
jgi:hypothetical protein